MNLSKLVDSFLSNDTNDEIKFYFQEVFYQEGFGKSRFHKYDVPNHTRELIRQYRKADFIPKKIKYYLLENIDNVAKDILLEIAMCFHDAGKKIMKDFTGSMKGHTEYTVKNQLDGISARFNFTENQKKYIGNIILYHDFVLNNDPNINEFLKENGIEIEGLIISLVDILSTQGEEAFKEEDIKKINFGKEKLLNIL